jgi:uncharacterized cupin superfamily protein
MSQPEQPDGARAAWIEPPPAAWIEPRRAAWIEVPRAALAGQGLVPYADGEITSLFDWAERTDGTSVHLMPHRGKFIVDIVEISANAVHQPCKPGDEVVFILNGILQLTTDADQSQQTYRAGEAVLIPAGWAGIYRVAPAEGRFRELAIVPADYFDVPGTPATTPGLPRRIGMPAAGLHELHRGRYLVTAEHRAAAAGWDMAVATEQIVHIAAGQLRLTAAGRTAMFGAGSVIILPHGFAGRAEAEAGYRAVNLSWL